MTIYSATENANCFSGLIFVAYFLRPQCRLSDPRQTIGLFVGPCPTADLRLRRREGQHGVDTCPWHPGVSTVRCPIPQRTFKYVATIQSVTDETCHNRILLVDPTLIDPEMQDCNPVSLNRNNRAS